MHCISKGLLVLAEIQEHILQTGMQDVLFAAQRESLSYCVEYFSGNHAWHALQRMSMACADCWSKRPKGFNILAPSLKQLDPPDVQEA